MYLVGGMKTVLVVEDTEDLREMFLDMLQHEGYRAVGAENGRVALEVLKSMRDEPCLVLLDMMMPVMDGREFIAALSDGHRLAALPIVVVSAVGGAGIPGAREVVKKPISHDVLRRLVSDFCGKP